MSKISEIIRVISNIILYENIIRKCFKILVQIVTNIYNRKNSKFQNFVFLKLYLKMQ